MTKERKYIDLTLELRDLDEEADRFKLSVLTSAVGETRDAVPVPYSHPDLEWMLADLERSRLNLEDVAGLGKILAERLLPAGEVRKLYNDALAKAGQDGGVRLRLIIRSPKLAQIPWEFTYDPNHLGDKTPDYFLAINPQISFVRHEALAKAPGELEAADPTRLNMLAVFANARLGGQRPLKLDVEKGVVEGALKDFDVEGVTIQYEPFIENATLDDLNKALKQKPDLFHFAGHGTFEEGEVDPETGETRFEGKIVLVEDKQSLAPKLLPAQEFARALQEAGVRLAMLGACHAGRRDGVSAWNSVAPALIQKGIPAVVAMQYEVIDEAAIAFNKEFYTALAAGMTVDEAVSAGRRAMLAAAQPSLDFNVQWGIPVLYLRSESGVLFPKLAERETQTAATIRARSNLVAKTIKAGASVVGILVDLEKLKSGADLESNADIDEISGDFTGIRLD